MAPRPTREPGRQGPDGAPASDVTGGGELGHPGARDEGRLLRAAALGDQQATQSLTQAHLDWVMRAAQERGDRCLSTADLFQEGTIGLMEAITAFHASGRADFEPFAKERVASRMDEALEAEERAQREAKLLVQSASDYVTAETNLRRELRRAPTTAEIAEKLEWSVERAEEIGQMVEDARRRHDEELLQYLDPDDLDLDTLPLLEERNSDDAG